MVQEQEKHRYCCGADHTPSQRRKSSCRLLLNKSEASTAAIIYGLAPIAVRLDYSSSPAP